MKINYSFALYNEIQIMDKFLYLFNFVQVKSLLFP